MTPAERTAVLARYGFGAVVEVASPALAGVDRAWERDTRAKRTTRAAGADAPAVHTHASVFDAEMHALDAEVDGV